LENITNLPSQFLCFFFTPFQRVFTPFQRVFTPLFFFEISGFSSEARKTSEKLGIVAVEGCWTQNWNTASVSWEITAKAFKIPKSYWVAKLLSAKQSRK